MTKKNKNRKNWLAHQFVACGIFYIRPIQIPDIKKHFQLSAVGQWDQSGVWSWLQIDDNPDPLWTREAVDGLSQGAKFYLVAVDQSDEEEQRAERDGTGQHSLHQEHRPAAQQEHMDKQPGHNRDTM